MQDRDRTFRIAVRKFGPFESALAKQWDLFERQHSTSLRLDAVPLDLHPLHDALFLSRGLHNGDWDAALISTDWLALAAEEEALVDLSPYIENSPPPGYPRAWSDSLLRLQQFGSAVIGLPYHDGPECLIYRRDLFSSATEQTRFEQQHGEALEVPQSWEQFARVARFFTCPAERRYGTAFAAYPDGHNTVYDFCLQLWTRGGELFDPSGRAMLNTSQAHEALAFYRNMLNDATAVHPDCRAFDSVKSGLAFAAGEIVMMVNWFGFASMSESIPESRVRGRVAIAPIPSDPGHKTSLNAYWVLGIPCGSGHREIAWDFLRHCARPEMDKLLTLEGGIGCRRSTWSDREVNAVIPFYRSLERLHEDARELPRLRSWPQIAAVIDQMVLEAANHEEPIAAILLRGQASLDRLCGQGAQP